QLSRRRSPVLATPRELSRLARGVARAQDRLDRGQLMGHLRIPRDSMAPGSNARRQSGELDLPLFHPPRFRWRSRPMRRSATGPLSVVPAIITGLVGMADTYDIFNATLAEPVHLESGIEWLEFSRLSVNPMHPPISRSFIAAGPYLHGVRWQNQPDFQRE